MSLTSQYSLVMCPIRMVKLYKETNYNTFIYRTRCTRGVRVVFSVTRMRSSQNSAHKYICQKNCMLPKFCNYH